MVAHWRNLFLSFLDNGEMRVGIKGLLHMHAR